MNSNSAAFKTQDELLEEAATSCMTKPSSISSNVKTAYVREYYENEENKENERRDAKLAELLPTLINYDQVTQELVSMANQLDLDVTPEKPYSSKTIHATSLDIKLVNPLIVTNLIPIPKNWRDGWDKGQKYVNPGTHIRTFSLMLAPSNHEDAPGWKFVASAGGWDNHNQAFLLTCNEEPTVQADIDPHWKTWQQKAINSSLKQCIDALYELIVNLKANSTAEQPEQPTE